MGFKAVIMSGKDNVATALEEIPALADVELEKQARHLRVRVKEPIPFGHKFAVECIPKGEKIIKYGQVIGAALGEIAAGAHVHTHNVESLRGRGDKH